MYLPENLCREVKMKKFRLLLIPLVLLLGIILYFWEPWQARQESIDFGSAGEVLKAAQSKMGKVENYKYKTNVLAGDSIKVNITNRVIVGNPRQQMADFSWDIPKMSGFASMYTEGESLHIYHPLKNKWLLPSEEPTVRPFIDFFWRQLALIDPVENILKIDPNGRNVSVINEPVQDTPDAVVVQVIPEGGALSEISKSLPPQFAGAELKDVRQLFWISKQDMSVSRYEVRAKVSFFGLKTMDFKTISRIQDYNNTKITLPKSLQEKMKGTK